jgi:hypothetical protein
MKTHHKSRNFCCGIGHEAMCRSPFSIKAFDGIYENTLSQEMHFSGRNGRYYECIFVSSNNKNSEIMNTLRTISFTFLAIIFSASLFAQSHSIEFKLQLLSDNVTWGVFVKPDNTISPSDNISTGSGQVTIVAPVDFAFTNFKNVSGTWMENARVDAPAEATDKSYVSFGFVSDEPRIDLVPNEETLLFTFTCDAMFTNTISLFDNIADPFATPNSYGSNPGNDIGVIDFSSPDGVVSYHYSRNYGTAPAFGTGSVIASNEEE